jgi:hypothetical protein
VISLKLDTKIMVFFLRNIIKSTHVLSIICNAICLQFSLYSFAEFEFVFIDFIRYFRF